MTNEYTIYETPDFLKPTIGRVVALIRLECADCGRTPTKELKFLINPNKTINCTIVCNGCGFPAFTFEFSVDGVKMYGPHELFFGLTVDRVRAYYNESQV